MLNHIFFLFLSGRGKGAIILPILRNLNSICTQKNSTLNNLNMQTPELGSMRESGEGKKQPMPNPMKNCRILEKPPRFK